ncbi:MAG: hypothetical protein JKY37_32500 [Nannocystaceae bacterium]|nr:hypothetical protein [Nannocystaceae bacterium]
MTRSEIFAAGTVDAVDAPNQLSLSDLSLSELSQELQRVEWLGEPGAAPSMSKHALGRGGVGHAADHWTFEVSLVVFGALMGVAAYFWTA